MERHKRCNIIGILELIALNAEAASANSASTHFCSDLEPIHHPSELCCLLKNRVIRVE